MDVYDPTLDSQEVQQALLQAAALRKQAAPQGQMVSGRYVKPSMSQQLLPLVSGIVADVKEQGARTKQRDIDRQSQEALSQWIGSRPQEQTNYQPTGDNFVEAAPVTTKPTTQDELAWAAKGLKNPLSKALAAKQMEDSLVAEPIRREKQADKLEASRQLDQRFDADRAARRDNLVLQLEGRHQDLLTKLTTVDANTALGAEIKRQALDTQAQIAQLRASSAERIAAGRNDTAVEVAGTKAGAAGGGKGMSATQLKEVAGLQDELRQQNTYSAGFDNSFTGLKVYGADKLRTTTGQVADKKMLPALEFWRNFRAGDNVLRHGLFGSALTAGEQAAWQSTTVGPNDSPEVIKKAIATRAKIVQDKYDARLALYNGGTPQADGTTAPRAPRPAAPTSALPRSTGRIPSAVQGARDDEAAMVLQSELTQAIGRGDMATAERTQRELERLNRPSKVAAAPAAEAPKVLTYNPATGRVE